MLPRVSKTTACLKSRMIVSLSRRRPKAGLSKVEARFGDPSSCLASWACVWRCVRLPEWMRDIRSGRAQAAGGHQMHQLGSSKLPPALGL